MSVEEILSILCIFSGLFSLACSNRAVGEKLAGFYKEGGSHRPKQAQLLVSGLIVAGFGVWWYANPGLLS
jgi:hypothetical protein